MIAKIYHWDRDTLWNMTLSERRVWADLIRLQLKVEEESITRDSNSLSTYTES